ncbi:FAS-associated factor 2 [Lemmus lemmus]
MLPFRFTYYTILDIFRYVSLCLYATSHIKKKKCFKLFHVVIFCLSQALNDAKRELRFLLVYLHGDDHQDSEEFCRNTLCAPEVVSLINSRMLFWACSTNKPEGYRVQLFLIVILNKDKYFLKIIRGKPASCERNQTQVLRQQQDEAYLASLRADQEKERKKREERERKRRKEEEVQQQKLAEERRRQNLQEEKERKLECLPPEPSPDDPESVKIIFKLPNDSRVERRFHFSQSLSVIHDFLFSLKESPEKFQIEANFPRRVLPCVPSEECPTPPTLQEAGLGHTEVLFVQDLTDE